MRVLINGTWDEVAAGTTVAEVVKRWARSADGVAVAVNEAVVSRGEWDATVLGEGDRVEILTAVQGG